MSRIGLKPIAVGTGVKVQVTPAAVTVEGPKGKLVHALPRGISAELADQLLLVKRAAETKRQRALHGLLRALLANAVTGVSQGFVKKLEIHGVGYSAEVRGRAVTFKLGYSHPVEFPIPQGIDIKVERQLVTVSGYDRQHVGQVAAEIRGLRPPDVYKQKGIRYSGETLRKKAGKTAAK
jgi:large subunit ribosomal protein L6